MSIEKIANLSFPDDLPSVEEILNLYPKRDLADDAMVVRLAPSPTGFLHIGTVYMGLINTLLAKKSNGVSILRIEDTDQKREVENAETEIKKNLEKFGISFSELETIDGVDKGEYGPYKQSKRKHLYHAFAKKLLLEDKAYPCFCTSEDLAKNRDIQVKGKVRTGYYGDFATCSKLTPEERLEKMEQGLAFSIRLRSTGKHKNRIQVRDLVKGKRDLPENDIDPVIIKSNDGLPTYHFAHVIDDYLMRTTHVIRGDEWFSSLPLHYQIFDSLGWDKPVYVHLAPIEKIDGNSRRKLSKRKDPEANVSHLLDDGYSKEALIEYLINIANSGFEDWRSANPTDPVEDFPIDLQKTSVSGALFDTDKLNNISKNLIAQMSNTEVFSRILNWAKNLDKDFATQLTENEAYFKNIFNIEREIANARKDLYKWSNVKEEIKYFFDETYQKPDLDSIKYPKDIIKPVLTDYLSILTPSLTRDDWWEKMKEAAEKNGFSANMKYYKKNKDEFNGSIADFVKIIRLVITGREHSPDVYAICDVIGKERIEQRFTNFLNAS